MKKKFLLKRGLVIMLSTALLVGQPSMVMAADAAPQDNPVLEETEFGLEEIEEVEEETEEASDEDVAEEETEDNGSESEEETEENASEEDTESEESEDTEVVDDEDYEIVIIEEEPEETEVDIVEVAPEMFPGIEAKNLKIDSADKASLAELEEYKSDWLYLNEGVDCMMGQITFEADSLAEAENIATAYNAKLIDYQYGWALAELNADSTYEKATVRDAVMASVEFEDILVPVWPNYYRFIDEEPLSENEMDDLEVPVEIIDENEIEEWNQAVYNDPFLVSTNANYQWAHYIVGSDIAGKNGYTGSGVKVGVIDTGFIASGHEDLSNSSITRVNILSADGKTTLAGTDDQNGHGTHVCGIIRETKNNEKGGVGIAPECTLYIASPVASAAAGTFNTYYETLAIRQLTDKNKVDIINMSLGGPTYCKMEKDAVAYAYSQGVAVFCAAGNENTNSLHYPAGYTGAISVGAVDRSLGRAFFSNSGSKVKYSAPGVDIVSTYYTGSNAYASMSGTSMACPIVAGEAAVILGAMGNKTRNKARLDTLIKTMNKGAVSPKDSGLGKIVNLPKALGLSNWNAVPVAPTFATKAGTYAKTSLDVTIEAEKQSVIYYSIDGKSITYKDGKLSANAQEYTDSITVGNQASVTVYAIAINDTTKVASKCVSAKYVFKPAADGVKITPKTGVTKVALGKSLNLVGTVTPAYSPEKTLVWSITDANGNPTDGTVKVDSKGKVSATAKATPGTYKVTAAVKGRETVKTTINVNVVKIPTNIVTSITTTKKSYTGLKGSIIEIAPVKVTYSDGTIANQSSLSWRTNIDGCSISATSIGFTVTCSVAGTYTLTGTSTDGTGKAITIKVTAKEPVASIKANSSYSLAQGKSISLGCTVTPDKAGKKLSYTISPADKGVTVSSAGKVTATSTAPIGSYTITVKALDGSDVSKTISLTVKKKLDKYTLAVDKTKVDVFRLGTGNTATVVTTGSFYSYICSVDKPDIAKVSYSSGVLTITGGKVAGTATVTFRTTDGSNLKKTIKVVNHNPISGFMIAPTKGQYSAGYGKSLKLGVTYFEEYGKVDAYAKKLTWSTANESLATVDQSGKVVGKSISTGTVKITATSLNGLTKSYTVNVGDAIKSISIEPYYGEGSTEGIISIPDDYSDGKTKKVAYLYLALTVTTAHKNGTPVEYYSSTSTDLANCITQPSSKYRDVVEVYMNKKGTYTITVKATDGSNASSKITLIWN